jgi:peptidoglycan/LPS O-acetylase OafA/YrhL
VGQFRFLLALVVLVSHSGLAPESLSRTAVGLFFLISGHLMQLTLDRNYRSDFGRIEIGKFYFNRVLRIYPLYWLALIVTAIFFPVYFADKTQNQHLGAIFLDYQSAGSVIGPAWTLPYEITYFALAPFVYYLGWKLAVIVSFGAVLIHLDFKIRMFLELLHPFAWGVSGSGAVAQAICLFAVGASTYQFKNFGSTLLIHQNLRKIIFGLFSVGCATMLASNWLYSREISFAFWETHSRVVNSLAILLTVVALSSWDGGESKMGKVLGQLSYPLYLLHWPLIQLILPKTAIAPYLRNFAKRFYLADYLLMTILVAIFSIAAGSIWLQIEKRMINPRRRAHLISN